MIARPPREQQFLRLRYRAIMSYTGVILVICGILMFSPLLVLPAYPDETRHALSFVIPAVVLVIIGATLWRILRPSEPVALNVQEGGVIVLLSWITVIVFSAWPFVEILGLDYTRSIFESVSGWTTTGLSVVDVSQAGSLVLIWRSIIQLAGGAGLAILMMSAVIAPAGAGVSSAEGRGDQLVPHVRKSARLILFIYCAYASAGVFAYRLAGMSFFDAINHAFAAVSTGGFSTQVESIGHWDSVTIECITMVLMVLGNLNFVTAWLLIRGKFRLMVRNGEVRLMAVLLPITAVANFFMTARGFYGEMGKSVRVAVFETVSALTTTGFSTVGYNDWNAFGVLVLIILMLIGGGTCSTAGGIKQIRIYLLWKMVSWELRRAILPQNAILERPIWEAERKVFMTDSRLSQVSVYVFLYCATFSVGTLILLSQGYSLHESLFEFASALGTVGLSIGVTSANTPDTVLWVQTAGMLLGRLEFFVIFISGYKIISDFKHMV